MMQGTTMAIALTPPVLGTTGTITTPLSMWNVMITDPAATEMMVIRDASTPSSAESKFLALFLAVASNCKIEPEKVAVTTTNCVVVFNTVCAPMMVCGDPEPLRTWVDAAIKDWSSA